MIKLDSRRHAYRSDLADAALKDKVRVPHYAEGEARQVCAPQIPVRSAPRFDAPLLTEALHGEFVTLFDAQEGWGWVQLRDDSYVGYTPLDGLSTVPEQPTHKVAARLTYVYPAPDIKQPPFMRLSFSSAVAVTGNPEGRMWELARGGYVFGDHLVGFREKARDFVRVAERMVGAPYLWGGKTALGIDCSGLVQVSLMAAGAQCPRDSDMQIAEIGEPIDPAELDSIQRGDLLFWKGHVAIAQSADWMVHASGAHMEVVVEPVRRAIERIGQSHGPLMAIRRPVIEAPARPRNAEIGRGQPRAASSPSGSEADQGHPELPPLPPQEPAQAVAPAMMEASAPVQLAPEQESPRGEAPAAKPAQKSPSVFAQAGPPRMRRSFHGRAAEPARDAQKREDAGFSAREQESPAQRSVPASSTPKG